MIRNKNIKVGYIETRELLYLDPEYEHQHRNKRLLAGDVVVVRTGYPGTAAVVPVELEGTQCFTSLIIRPEKSVLDSEYLCAFINSDAGQRQFSAGSAGGAQKNVNAGTLSRMTIPLPPIARQRSVVTVVRLLEGIVRQQSQLVDAKRTLRRGLVQQLLTGQNRFPEFRDTPWVTKSLGDYFSEKSVGNSDRSATLVYSCTKSVGIVPQTERFAKRLASTDVARYKVVERGDLVYDPMLLWDGSIGFVPQNGRGVVSPAYESFSVNPSQANRDYFWSLLKTGDMIQRYQQISQGTNTRRRKASPKEFLRLSIKMPPTRREQDRIAELVDLMQREIELLEALLRQIETQKRALLSRLLAGELQIPA